MSKPVQKTADATADQETSAGAAFATNYAQALKSDASKTLETGKSGGAALVGAVGDATKNPQSLWERFTGIFSGPNGMDVGKIIAGLGGLAAAYFGGSMLGDIGSGIPIIGGAVPMILTIALAFPFMSIFSDKGGPWINGLLGTGKSDNQPAAEPEKPAPKIDTAQAQAQLKAQEEAAAKSQAAAANVTVFSQDEMNAMLEHAKKAGITATSVTFVNHDNKIEWHIEGDGPHVSGAHVSESVADLNKDFDQARNAAGVAAITFAPNGADRITRTLGIQKGAASQSR